MNAEDIVGSGGQTYGYLEECLKLIECPDHWKGPLSGVIHISMLDDCREAAAYFCGSPLEIVKIVSGEKQTIEVFGRGYWQCVGA